MYRQGSVGIHEKTSLQRSQGKYKEVERSYETVSRLTIIYVETMTHKGGGGGVGGEG